MGYGWGTLTGEKPRTLTTSTQTPFGGGGGQAKQEITFFSFGFCNLVINSSGQGEEGTAETKGLRIPLELGP